MNYLTAYRWGFRGATLAILVFWGVTLFHHSSDLKRAGVGKAFIVFNKTIDCKVHAKTDAEVRSCLNRTYQ
jgi:hypothetical protein